MAIRKFAMVVLVLLVTASLTAQERKPKIEWERWEGEGTVAAYRGGALLMTLKGEPWVGAVSPASRVSITGSADREVLRPGIVVQLSGEFDRKTGVATQPVSELAIVTARPGERTGIFPDEAFEFGEKKKGPPPPTIKLRVFDAISGMKDNTLIFKKYRVELAPDAKITLDVADPSLLSEGDAIKKVKGRRLKGTQGRLIVEEMEAVLAQPLAPKKKTLPSAPQRGSTAKDIFNVAGEEAAGKKSDNIPGGKAAAKKENTKEPDPRKKESGKQGAKKDD